MAEFSRFWSGTTVGDSGPYSDQEFTDVFSALFQDRTTQGPLRGYLDQLRVAQFPQSVPIIQVNPGAALVDGTFYLNTEAINIDLSTYALYETSYFTVMLVKDFSAQTVRVVVLSSQVGFSNPSQIEGSAWYIPLANVRLFQDYQFDIDDRREFCSPNFDAIDGVFMCLNRGGQDYSNWSTPSSGGMNLSVTPLQVIPGIVQITDVPIGGSKDIVVSFGRGFYYPPVVIASPNTVSVGASANVDHNVLVIGTDEDSATFRVFNHSAALLTTNVSYVAFGQRIIEGTY